MLAGLPVKEGLMKRVALGLLTLAAAIPIAGCEKAGTAANTSDNEAATAAADTHGDPIASAEAAAPAAVSGAATIVMSDASGKMQVLRKGSNSWTCMPDNPATPGPDPMCMDPAAMRWAEAWIGHKTPPADGVGLMYMLAGGTDASNTDPYATKPDGDWVKTGPHLMVVGSQALLRDYPAGAKPDTRAPYVMWAGTPYAHLMIPIGDSAQ